MPAVPTARLRSRFPSEPSDKDGEKSETIPTAVITGRSSFLASSSARPSDNSAAILLTFGTARVLLAGDAEARGEAYLAEGSYTRSLTIINVPKLHTV